MIEERALAGMDADVEAGLALVKTTLAWMYGSKHGKGKGERSRTSKHTKASQRITTKGHRAASVCCVDFWFFSFSFRSVGWLAFIVAVFDSSIHLSSFFLLSPLAPSAAVGQHVSPSPRFKKTAAITASPPPTYPYSPRPRALCFLVVAEADDVVCVVYFMFL
jgi:hypothetical protein